jgi:hypothetical protein
MGAPQVPPNRKEYMAHLTVYQAHRPDVPHLVVMLEDGEATVLSQVPGGTPLEDVEQFLLDMIAEQSSAFGVPVSRAS